MEKIIHKQFWQSKICFGESRLLGFAMIEEVPLAAGNAIDMRTWKQLHPDASRVLDYFSTVDPTIDELETFALTIPSGAPQFELDLQYQLDLRSDVSQPSRIREEADGKITRLMAYLKSRRDTLKTAKNDVRDLRDQEEYFHTPITQGIDIVKNHVSQIKKGFDSASGPERKLMLAGLAAMSFMLIAAYRKIPVFRRAAHVMLFLGAGSFVLNGLEKVFMKSYGRPLIGSLDFPMLTQTAEQWQEKKRLESMSKLYKNLQELNISDAFLTNVSEGDSKYLFGISNIVTMDTESFIRLYQEGWKKGTLPDGAPGYPHRPYRKDTLTPIERYRLVQDIAETLGLIDSDGKPVPLDDSQKKQTMLYRFLDYQ